MVRLACVNAKNLDLQLLLKKHPAWRSLPAAVVSRDSPYATILTVNKAARAAGISPGLRYAAGLSFTPELRAGTTTRAEVEHGVSLIARCLRSFSPQVEAHEPEPGLFWLDAGGLTSLYPSPEQWCVQIRSRLLEEGFEVTIAVGFSRFGCYAAAKVAAAEGQVVFSGPEQESEAALKMPLEVLALSPEVLQRLAMLGIRTVGRFLRLPAGGIRRRFGPETEEVYNFAAGALDLPLQPAEVEEEPEYFKRLPLPEQSRIRILKFLERYLDPFVRRIKARKLLVRELRVSFVLEDGEIQPERILPSTPSTDTRLLLELLSLRLERKRLASPVEAFHLFAETVVEANVQAELFPHPSAEAFREAQRVFARLRAVFGNDAVQRARLEDDHLPERSFSWENLHGLDFLEKERSGEQPVRCLVRRILKQPAELHGFDPAAGRPARRLWGPHPLSSRWWSGEQSREYYYAETGDGNILWIHYDRLRQRWLVTGGAE